jgi:hypothetical protein
MKLSYYILKYTLKIKHRGRVDKEERWRGESN